MVDELLEELARLRAAQRRHRDREYRRRLAARRVVEASEALEDGAEAIALAKRLGFVSANDMVDAVMNWRRANDNTRRTA